MRRGPFDMHNLFFKPMWRRVGVVIFLTGWTAVEFTRGAPVWGVLFGALGLFTAYHFFITWPKDDDEGRAGGSDDKT